MNKEILNAAGIDADGALARLMGSEALMGRLFRKFLEDGTFSALTAAIETQDKEGALTASHTLKGMCGNLPMDRLYGLFTEQVNRMRSGDWEGAVGMMPQIGTDYEEAVAAIRECFG